MGQPGAVLPESLDEPTGAASTTSIASADDLLAQLAGEEIDRLLAESDAEQVASVAVQHADEIIARSLAGESPALTMPAAAPARESRVPSSDLPAENPTIATSSRPIEPSAPALARESSARAAPAAASRPPKALEPAAATDPPATPRPTDADVTESIAERAALNELLNQASASTASIPPGSGTTHPTLPFYLKPLEWVNAPLRACPESVLEVVGKVAIVTLVNAIAVLIYVLLFRQS